MRNIVCFALAFVGLYQFTAQAQWEQVGNTIEASSGYRAGMFISLNSQGNKLVASFGVDNWGNEGYVEVYELVNDTWQLLGNRINFPPLFSSAPIRFFDVDIDSSGQRIIIGDRGYSVSPVLTPGRVLIYDLINNTWNQVFEFVGNGSEEVGRYVSISDDGNRVVFENRRFGNDGNGRILAYEYSGSNWIPLGNQIIGNANNGLGRAVVMSGDGTTLATYSGESSNETASFKVYQYTSGNWLLKGAPIDLVDGQSFAAGVDLTNNGNIVIIGDPAENNNGGYGSARVFAFSGNDWELTGQPILGVENVVALGSYPKINAEGNIISFMTIDLNPFDKGVSVYKLISNTWQLQNNIIPCVDGLTDNDISLNNYGNITAVSSFTGLNVSSEDDGIMIFRNDPVLDTKSESYLSQVTIHPNPSEGYFKMEGLDFHLIESIQLFDLSGRLVKAFSRQGSNGIFNMSDLQSGSYLVKIESSSGAAFKQLIKK